MHNGRAKDERAAAGSPNWYHRRVELPLRGTPSVTSEEDRPGGVRPPRDRDAAAGPANRRERAGRNPRPKRDQGDLWSEAAAPAAPPEAAANGRPRPGRAAYAAPSPATEGQRASPASFAARDEAAAGPPEEQAGPDEAAAFGAEPDPGVAPFAYDDGPPLAYARAAAEESLLRNPYVLAGLAVAASIFLAVFVVAVFGQSGGGAPAAVSATSGPATPRQGAGLTVKSNQSATVRDGPGAEYAELGLLPPGRDTTVVGRNREASWYQILYPPDTNLKGWVPAGALGLPEDAEDRVEVVLSSTISRPTVPPPTPAPTEAATPTPAPTQPQAGPIDLAVSVIGGTCSAGNQLVVSLRNAGDAPITGRQAHLTVSTQSGALGELDVGLALGPGQSVSVNTGQQARAPRTTVTAVLSGQPQDSNAANNIAVCEPGGGGSGGQPTAVPPPIGTQSAGDDD